MKIKCYSPNIKSVRWGSNHVVLWSSHYFHPWLLISLIQCSVTFMISSVFHIVYFYVFSEVAFLSLLVDHMTCFASAFIFLLLVSTQLLRALISRAFPNDWLNGWIIHLSSSRLSQTPSFPQLFVRSLPQKHSLSDHKGRDKPEQSVWIVNLTSTSLQAISM